MNFKFYVGDSNIKNKSKTTWKKVYVTLKFDAVEQ